MTRLRSHLGWAKPDRRLEDNGAQGLVGLLTSYLEPPFIVAELAGQEGVERVVCFLLQAAIHENVDYFPLLLVLEPKPTKHKQQRGNFNLPNLNRLKAETFPGPHLSGSLVKREGREGAAGGLTKQD